VTGNEKKVKKGGWIFEPDPQRREDIGERRKRR
jgi:hypothetical protein